MCKNMDESGNNASNQNLAQTFVATVGTAAVMSEVNWKVVISATVLAGFLSIATSLTGLPECEEKEKS